MFYDINAAANKQSTDSLLSILDVFSIHLQIIQFENYANCNSFVWCSYFIGVKYRASQNFISFHVCYCALLGVASELNLEQDECNCFNKIKFNVFHYWIF